MPNFLKGATPSPRHRLAAAIPHTISSPIVPVPQNFLWKPAKISMWGNDVHGDCVTAEEAFAKACHSPEFFIPDDEVIAWATKNGVLEGTDLTTVLDLMQTGGFPQSGSTLNDGPPVSVDWTNPAILLDAILWGPVKLGIAADQLQPIVEANPRDGWVATGFTPDNNEDHCVSCCGYGTLSWLAEQLGGTVPDGVSEFTPGYAIFTWDTIGIIDLPSFQAIPGEAWLRVPNTIVSPTSQEGSK